MANPKESNYTHPSVNTVELVEDILHSIDVMPRMGLQSAPIMVWGQPGIGKSDVVRQVGKLLGRLVIDIRLLLKDPTDLSGIPFLNIMTQRMDYSSPSDLPPSADELQAFNTAIARSDITIEKSEVKPDKFERNNLITKVQNQKDLTDHERSLLVWLVEEGNAIIFLDELSSATPAVQAAALQLVLERRIGTYVLPENVSIVAAGNRAEDATQHFSMPAPLRNRFSHRTLEADFDSWESWALDSNIHPMVVGYLKNSKDSLNGFDPKNKAAYAFPTPRSWKFVSDYMWSISDMSGRVVGNFKVAKRNIEGLIGSGVASGFMASYETMGQMPSAEDILNGNVKKFDLTKFKNSMGYMLTVNLCYTMKDLQAKLQENEDKKAFRAKMEEYGDHYFRFLMANMDYQEDFIIMGASMALNRYGLRIDDSEGLTELLEKYENIMDRI